MVGPDSPDSPTRGRFRSPRGGLLVAPGNRPVPPETTSPNPTRSGRERLLVARPLATPPTLLERVERLQGPALESLVKRLVVQEGRRAIVIVSRWPGEGRSTVVHLLARALRRVDPQLRSLIIESTGAPRSNASAPLLDDDQTVRWIDAGPQPDEEGAVAFSRTVELIHPEDAALLVQRVGFTRERDLNELIDWARSRDLMLVGIVRTFASPTKTAQDQAGTVAPH